MIPSISIPFGIFKFQNHKNIKPLILQDMDNSPYPGLISYDHSISKTDWGLSNDKQRKYIAIFLSEIHNDLIKFAKSLHFDKYLIHEIWFQQYIKGNSHSWHNHTGCQYTCIYYLEFSESCPPTQFLNPVDESNIFQIGVEEGDVLVIPSMIKHQAPIITNNSKKTIISFNLSFICDNNATGAPI